jgi:hypothetical protein
MKENTRIQAIPQDISCAKAVYEEVKTAFPAATVKHERL